MDRETLAPRIDHTCLGPLTTSGDVDTVLETATNGGMGACIPPSYLDRADAYDCRTVTVVGFPHGQHDPATKRAEAVRAVEAGADELDVVITLGRLLDGRPDAVTGELQGITEAVDVPVKAILETPSLEARLVHQACEAAVAADVSMLKTATGFGAGGATVEDVALLSEYAPVKASGGIRSYEDAMRMIDAGAVRVGTSSGKTVLEEAPE